MLSSTRCFPISTFILSFLYFIRITDAATGEGSVSLFSDSGCDDGYSYVFSNPVTIALNLTVPADTCYSLSRAAHSYEVDSHPTCNDGTAATFAYYEYPECHNRRARTEPHHSPSDNATGFDGYCLALVEFNSLAFLCEGVQRGGNDSTSSVLTTSQSETTTGVAPESATVTATPTATLTYAAPIAPTFSPTVPLYPPHTFLGTGVFSGTGTAPGGPSPTTGVVPPSPLPFNAANSRKTSSFVGICAMLVARLLL